MERRTFVQSVSAVAVGTTALAGCSSPGSSAENGSGGVEEGLGTDVTGEPLVGNETDGGGGGGGMGTDTADGVPDLDETIGQTPAGIEVSDTGVTHDDEQIRVRGSVENTGDQAVDEVEVAVTLLDDSEAVVGQFFHGTEAAEAQSLEPGSEWEFAVGFPAANAADAASYRIDVDTTIDGAVDVGNGTGTGTSTETGTDTTSG